MRALNTRVGDCNKPHYITQRLSTTSVYIEHFNVQDWPKYIETCFFSNTSLKWLWYLIFIGQHIQFLIKYCEWRSLLRNSTRPKLCGNSTQKRR